MNTGKMVWLQIGVGLILFFLVAVVFIGVEKVKAYFWGAPMTCLYKGNPLKCQVDTPPGCVCNR